METWRNKQRGRRWWSLKFWGWVWVHGSDLWFCSVALKGIRSCSSVQILQWSQWNFRSKPQTWYFTSGFICNISELWVVYQAQIVCTSWLCCYLRVPRQEILFLLCWRQNHKQLGNIHQTDRLCFLTDGSSCSLCAFYSSREDVVCVERKDFTAFAPGGTCGAGLRAVSGILWNNCM